MHIVMHLINHIRVISRFLQTMLEMLDKSRTGQTL